MVRKFLVSVIMLFCILHVYPIKGVNKKRIVVSKNTQNNDLLIPNRNLEQLNAHVKQDAVKKSKKNIVNQQFSDLLLTDIPRFIDVTESQINTGSHEVRYEFSTKQSVLEIQEFYVKELTRLGWNVELFSIMKESIIMAQKPLKKVVIIIDIVKAGWFSREMRKVVIFKKEQ